MNTTRHEYHVLMRTADRQRERFRIQIEAMRGDA
jgi:hypothetical protein